MTPQNFIINYREAFGKEAQLPLALWYSDQPVNAIEKVGGCMFRIFNEVLRGNDVSYSVETIGCGGGKLYTGFAPMNDYIPGFVSRKEHYKDSPDAVKEYINRLDIQPASGKYLNFARIDHLEDFGMAEGLLFFATPDQLSGLCSWAFYDNHEADAVSLPFGSGCSSTVTNIVNENRRGGQRCFIGLLDPSCRPYFDANVLSFGIPMSRLCTMLETMDKCCLLTNTVGWNRVKERLTNDD